MKRDEVIDYIQSYYGVAPEHPWAKLPKYLVFRHTNNSKWFAVMMSIPANKLYEGGGGKIIDIINLKAAPELVGSLRLNKGVYPAYHMNKEHWVTVHLNSDFNKNELTLLIDESYKLTYK